MGNQVEDVLLPSKPAAFIEEVNQGIGGAMWLRCQRARDVPGCVGPWRTPRTRRRKTSMSLHPEWVSFSAEYKDVKRKLRATIVKE